MAARLFRLPYPALVLLSVALASSYHFFQINNMKLLVFAIAIAALALIGIAASLADHTIARGHAALLRTWFTLALPILGTVPGFLLHLEMSHYNLPVELAGNLLLIVWTILLSLCIRDRRDVPRLLAGVGFTLAAVSGFAVLEGFGWLRAQGPPSEDLRVLGTFGNPNVLAAFLVPLLPLLLVWTGRRLANAREEEGALGESRVGTNTSWGQTTSRGQGAPARQGALRPGGRCRDGVWRV
jgi:hypothetical protein